MFGYIRFNTKPILIHDGNIMDVLTEKEVRESMMFAVDVVLCGAVAYPELISGGGGVPKVANVSGW